MVLEENSTTNQQVNAIVPNEGVHPHYLYYAVAMRSQYLSELSSRAAIPIVNKSNFAEFLVHLPPYPEQRKIANILTTVDKKIEAEQQRKLTLQSLFKTILHLLMTGQVQINDLEVTAGETGL
jgi:type I restriction enzyme S subunit